MRGRIWGCRGSLASPGAATVRVGGNTSCIELRTDSGAVLVLDAGTGIRPLGLALAAEGVREIDLLLTHLHLDHLEGLGFFAPLFEPGCRVRIHGPRAEGEPLRERIATYLSPPLFPLRFEQIPAHIEFVDVWDEEWQLGDALVRSAPVRHPGPTVGYSVAADGRRIVFLPDNEPALDSDSGLALARGADLLLHDAQYTDEEYAVRVGWGHSSLSDFAAFVRATEPRAVLMHHHDPAHTDDELDAMEVQARTLAGRDDIRLARDGLELNLG